MRGLYHDCDSERIQCLLDAVPDLNGKTLLDLKPAGISLHHSGYLAQPGNLPVGYIGHVCLADEWQHMVLAGRIEFNVLDEDHLLVLLVENGGLDDLNSVLGIALRHELHSLRHPLRCLQQSFPLNVLTEKLQYFPDVSRNLLRGLSIIFLF